MYETPRRQQVHTALRALVRASAPRPTAAKRAAKDFEQPLLPAVRAEVRWAFHPPRTWLSGVVANLVFATVWLLVQPLTAANGHSPSRHFHHNQLDWVVLVSTYFSSFVLADVTTTNLLGGDHYRVAKGLSDGVPLWRMLLIKNLALLAIVGLPTPGGGGGIDGDKGGSAAAGHDDPQRRGAHRVLARGGQRHFRAASGARRAP